MNRLYRLLEWLCYRKLSCRIDKRPVALRLWWYNKTGRWAAFFHRRTCEKCLARHRMQAEIADVFRGR